MLINVLSYCSIILRNNYKLLIYANEKSNNSNCFGCDILTS